MNILIANLLQTYEALAGANGMLGDALRAHPDMPMYLPTYRGEPEAQLETVIRSLTEIWNVNLDVELLNAGVICAPQDVKSAIVALNAAKTQFKESVQAIRQADIDHARAKDQAQGKQRKRTARNEPLIEVAKRCINTLGKGRGEGLLNAMRTAQISRLDLLKCYRHIRVLEATTESISWTWARSHASSIPLTIEEAAAKALQLPDSSRATALKLLGELRPGTPITQRKHLPNQLQANVVWTKNGVRTRRAFTISGIVVCPCETLPTVVWRENPGNASGDRLQRMDARISDQPYIRALNIYLYDKGTIDNKGAKTS